MKAIAAVILAVAVIPAAALAQSVRIPAKVGIVKPQLLAKFVSKSTTPFALPSGANQDPTVNGAEIHLFDTASGGSSFIHALPQSGWVGLGNPVGSKGYKYSGRHAVPTDTTCSVVLIKPTVIKAVCKGSAVTLSTPFADTEGVIIGIPDTTSATLRYCAELNGTEKKNSTAGLKRVDAPAPAACPGDMGWVLYAIDDCSGDDTGCSAGATPNPLLCDNSTAGTTAVCWDGVTYSNGIGCSSSAWCTYKSTSTILCTGGGSPGFVYTCVPP